MATHICVNSGPGNGLVADGTKSLPEPMLSAQAIIVLNEFENHTFKLTVNVE